MREYLPIDGLSLERDEQALHLWSDEPLAVLSSAVVGADLAYTRHIINIRVGSVYKGRTPSEDLTARARELGIGEPFVGLMTAARLEHAQVIFERDSQTAVVAVVTMGLRHPIAAGVTEAFCSEPGTINIILAVEARLSPAARVNAVITTTEAKTLALVEAGVRAPHGGWASGTGTDAIVIATTERGAWFEYAGPISPVGALIGRAVRRTILNALSR